MSSERESVFSARPRAAVLVGRGCVTLLVLRWMASLEGPKSPPLFSERNGYRKVLPLGRGWRVIFKRRSL